MFAILSIELICYTSFNEFRTWDSKYLAIPYSLTFKNATVEQAWLSDGLCSLANRLLYFAIAHSYLDSSITYLSKSLKMYVNVLVTLYLWYNTTNEFRNWERGLGSLPFELTFLMPKTQNKHGYSAASTNQF